MRAPTVLVAVAVALLLVPGAAAEQFDSGELEPGASWTYTFEHPTKFTFHDHKNPQAEGTVHVTNDTDNTTEVVTIQIRDADGAVVFDPSEVMIEVGDDVRWTNIGSDVHQVMGWTEGDEMDMTDMMNDHHQEGDHGHEHGHSDDTAEAAAMTPLLALLAALGLVARRRRA